MSFKLLVSPNLSKRIVYIENLLRVVKLSWDVYTIWNVCGEWNNVRKLLVFVKVWALYGVDRFSLMCTCGEEYVDVVNVHNLLQIYHIHMFKIIPARCPSTKRALISPDSCSGTSVMCCLQGCAPPSLSGMRKATGRQRRLHADELWTFDSRGRRVWFWRVCLDAWTRGVCLQSVCIKRLYDVGRVAHVQGTCKIYIYVGFIDNTLKSRLRRKEKRDN